MSAESRMGVSVPSGLGGGHCSGCNVPPPALTPSIAAKRSTRLCFSQLVSFVQSLCHSSAKRCNFLGSFSTEASAAISCQLRLHFWKLGKAMRSLPLQSGRYVPGILPQLSRCSKAVTIPSSVKTELYNSLEKARRLAEAWKSQAISLRASEPLDR
jgi:hypothetical protein